MKWIPFNERNLFLFPPKPNGLYLIAFTVTEEGNSECYCSDYKDEDEECDCITEDHDSAFRFNMLSHSQFNDSCSFRGFTYKQMSKEGYPPIAKGYHPNYPEGAEIMKFHFWAEITDPTAKHKYPWKII